MKKSKVVLAAAGVALVALIAARFLQKEEVVQYEVRPTVIVENPKKEDIVLYTDMTGLVQPQSQASVMPKIGGEVLEVYFQAGDYVEAGTPLLKIDSDALKTLKLQLDAAAVQLKDTTSTVNRTRALYADGFVSEEVMEQAENGLSSVTISYETAKTQYELQLEYTTVTAPISGVIESRGVDPHDHIDTQTVVCSISGADQLEVKFGVTEKVHRILSVGDSLELEKNGVSYEAFITEIGSMVNSSTGLYDVRASVPQADGLTSGTRVKLVVNMDRAIGALTVPLTAVSYDNGEPFVYLCDGTKAVKTYFESGIYDSERMEVVSGITESDQVITTWSNELVDQCEILIKGTEETSQEGAGEDK